MIQASELRIGNYVMGLTKNLIKVDIHHLTNILRRPTMYYPIPIPLTNELLLRCGFVGSKNVLHLSLPIDLNGNLPYFLWSKGYLKLVDFEENEIQEIFSIHQLQNLYFALSGKELDIRLPLNI